MMMMISTVKNHKFPKSEQKPSQVLLDSQKNTSVASNQWEQAQPEWSSQVH